MSRCCVFINSNDPSIRNQLINTISFIKPKFPPKIDLRELIMKQTYDESNRASGRAPNAFIIYRKAFVEAARKDGYQLPMTIVSSMASRSWDLEPDLVKEEYKRLAKEANAIRNKLIPRLTCRRRRQKWNIVTFPPTTPPPPKPPTKSSIPKSSIPKSPIPKSPTPSNNKSSSVINKSKSITEEKKSEIKETPFFPSFSIPYDITSPIIDRFQSLDDSMFDNNFTQQQHQQQQHNHQLHFNNFIPPAYYYVEEQAVGTFTGNTFNTVVDTEISTEYINNNEFFEQESSGFLSFYNDYEIPYPSFWEEF